MGPAGAGATANANAITNVNLNVNVGVNLNVGMNVNSIRQFRYLLHFRQGAWPFPLPQRFPVRLHLLATFAACPVPSSSLPLPLP